jgi:putative transposase
MALPRTTAQLWVAERTRWSLTRGRATSRSREQATRGGQGSRDTSYLTCCLDGRRPLLRDPSLAERLIALYADQRDRGRIALHGYVVMPDHYHVVLTLKGDASISGVVRAVHSLFDRHCRATTEIRGRIWQRRFYDRVVRSDSDWREKLNYMHGNPVRSGHVASASEYEWSSAGCWETGKGVVRCDGLWGFD